MINENAFLISQILIGFAFLSDLLAFQFKVREKVLSFIAVSCFFISLHFIFLEAYAGAFLSGTAMLRSIVSIFTTNRKVMWIFFVFIFVGFYSTFERTIDLIGLFSHILFNIAAFEKTDKRLRQIIMGGTSCWIVYNVLVFSPAGIALEANFLLSNLVGYYRFYIRKPSLKKNVSIAKETIKK